MAKAISTEVLGIRRLIDDKDRVKLLWSAGSRVSKQPDAVFRSRGSRTAQLRNANISLTITPIGERVFFY
jgi:hypothetical protein